MIDNINKKTTKYTLNEVIGDGEDTLSISSYSTKKTMCNINNKTISGQ